jgi:hypothetical protein
LALWFTNVSSKPAFVCSSSAARYIQVIQDISVDGARAPRNPLAVGHCGNPGGLRRRLNPSLRGPRNDDRSRERSINATLRETEIFRPSKAGAIVGSAHRGPCADKQRVRGRTAPPVPTTSVVPLIRCADLRCTQVTEARFAPDGQSVPHSRYRRIELVGFNHQRGSGPNEVRATCSERSEEQSKRLLPDPLAPTRAASHLLGRLPMDRDR